MARPPTKAIEHGARALARGRIGDAVRPHSALVGASAAASAARQANAPAASAAAGASAAATAASKAGAGAATQPSPAAYRAAAATQQTCFAARLKDIAARHPGHGILLGTANSIDDMITEIGVLERDKGRKMTMDEFCAMYRRELAGLKDIEQAEFSKLMEPMFSDNLLMRVRNRVYQSLVADHYAAIQKGGDAGGGD